MMNEDVDGLHGGDSGSARTTNCAPSAATRYVAKSRARTTLHESRTRCPSRAGHSVASVRGGTRTTVGQSGGGAPANGAVVLASGGVPDGLGGSGGGESSGAIAKAEEDAAEAFPSQPTQKKSSASSKAAHQARAFMVIVADYACSTRVPVRQRACTWNTSSRSAFRGCSSMATSSAAKASAVLKLCVEPYQASSSLRGSVPR